MKSLPSNRFRAPNGLGWGYIAGAVAVMANILASSALANKITFETAPLEAFTGPVIEDGFTYSKLSGSLLVNPLLVGNPGKDVEGTISGGGVLRIVPAVSSNFNFNTLDFLAFDISGTGSQTLIVEGFLGGLSVGVDQYTLLNTKVFNPKYDKSLMPLLLVRSTSCRAGRLGDGDAEQGAECCMPGAPTVEAEDEFIEVGLEMLAAQPVINAQGPDLEVGEDLFN